MCVVTKVNKIRNGYIRRSLDAKNMTGKMWENRLIWFGYVEKRINDDIVKKIDEIRLKVNRGKG